MDSIKIDLMVPNMENQGVMKYVMRLLKNLGTIPTSLFRAKSLHVIAEQHAALKVSRLSHDFGAHNKAHNALT
jgi:hypothetical protein